jgi:hypothetical protein
LAREFAAHLQFRDVTLEQLIAIASRSFDDEAQFLNGPLPSRSEDGGASLSNMAPDLDPKVHPPRSEDRVTEMVQARKDIIRRDLTPDHPVARGGMGMDAVMNSRNVSPEPHRIEARKLASLLSMLNLNRYVQKHITFKGLSNGKVNFNGKKQR